MKRVPIRTKLAAALAVPLLGLCAITAIEVVDTSRDVQRVHDQTELARASIGPAGVLTEIQDERTWTVTELIGADALIGVPVTDYEEAWNATDQAIAAFRDTVAGSSATVQDAYRPALENLSKLQEIRTSVQNNTEARGLAPTMVQFADEIFTSYAELIEPFFDATQRVAIAVDDGELRQWTTLVGRASQQVEGLGNLSRRLALDSSLGDGINAAAEIAAASRLRDEFESVNQELLQAPEPFASVVDASFDHDLVDNFSVTLESALAGQQVTFDALMESLNVPPTHGYMGLRDQLAGGLNTRADELNADAASRERLYIGLAILTVGAALVLTWLVSRSITRPLRSLTRQATEMAERRLPDAVNQILDTPPGEDVAVPHVAPVAVQTRDEVADVAAALNTVQDTALDLAIEQAVLRRNIADSFVNLGRRNQNLLGRQLDFITELESNETDPQTLSDLFRLDHLATRMRRNAESLLVLAGFDPPRKWAAPVRLSDVIRAALGEVEEYHRVNVRDVEPATILGSAAADLAHLMAELVENSLVFSPPDQSVDIRGRQLRQDGPTAGAYTLAIIDAGLGMPESDLNAANRRLAGTESFTIAPSKYLGHYVAGNLAARHGIRVTLDHSPGNGVTATVTIPPELLTTDPVTAAPVTPPHGQRAVRLVPGIELPTPGPRGPLAVPPPAVAAAAAAAATGPQSAGAPPIWPRTLPPMPMSGPDGGIRAAGPAAPPPAPPLGRPPVRPPLSPLEAEASLLAALPRYAPSRGRPGGPKPRGESATPPPARPAPPSSPLPPAFRPPTLEVPANAGGPRPPADTPLTHRVAGAQLPNTDVVQLHDQRGPTARPLASQGPAPSPAAYSAASNVHTLLTTFTAGVQRGLEETRRRKAAAAAGGNGHRGSP